MKNSEELKQFYRIYDKSYTIIIPTKVEAKVDRHIKVKELKTISEDLIMAKDLIMMFLSLFSQTNINYLQADQKEDSLRFRRLYSKILKKDFSYNRETRGAYTKIINLCIKHGIIEVGRNYSSMHGRSREYGLTKRYFCKGLVKYTLKSPAIIKRKLKEATEHFEEVASNPIGFNELVMGTVYQYPTMEEAEAIIRAEIKKKHINKSGKRLVWLGKHSKKEYPRKDFVYGEEYLKRYEYTYLSKKMPIIGSKEAGGRVYTQYNMMPEIIRNHVTINGEKLVESDYSTLHPNIANTLYGENKDCISHDIVAEALNITRDEAKRHHLTFFNQTLEKMQFNKVYEYYKKSHPELLRNLENDKMRYGYRITSEKMAEFETAMMTEIIKQAMDKGLKVAYCFDALFCKKDEIGRVKEIMQNVADEYNVNTRC